MSGENTGKGVSAAVVGERARAVLENNWTGSYTTPATGLYPHQWSWDSAFIVMGLRHVDAARARLELRTLLDAQWRDGRLPQIVYDPERAEEYQPGAQFWSSETLASSGPHRSAGLVQPPNHAWAAWLVHCSDPDGSRREGFLAAVYPALQAWHEFLLRDRTDTDLPLAAVVHPWESGTDNSPLWDAAMAPLPKVHHAIPRPDLQHADASERPSQKEYGTYYWLAERYRDQQCEHGGRDWPFLLVDPCFNALWARSEEALAEIAATLGRDAAPHRRRAAEIADHLERLFVPELGVYGAWDVHAQTSVRIATINGLAPLVLGSGRHVDEVVAALEGMRFLGGERMSLAPSYDATAPDFRPEQYWRGPAWFNMNWLVVQGLRRHGRTVLADRLAETMVGHAVGGEFPEYVDPRTGEPHGSRRFSWTAALVLDLLA